MNGENEKVNDNVIHDWEVLTKELVNSGYDAQVMQEYISMLHKPRMMKPREIPKLVDEEEKD